MEIVSTYFAEPANVVMAESLFDPLPPGPVISMRVTDPKQVKCHSYQLRRASSVATKFLRQGPKKSASAEPRPQKAKVVSNRDGQAPKSERSRTRFRPPGDVVKLEQRLFYLLQPPLEQIFQQGELELPFQPFPYQLTGIGFLYPRHAAILADEMGLGKTMQAITSLRLLLHSQEVSSALLICPKPLIPNWQREFALWAPEIPVALVEGSAEQRRWAWQRQECPIKIANYESVLRDSHLIEERLIGADIVVLDEAQRIKNLNSSTSQVIREIPRRRSWALTGTPIENSTDDLVGIFEFLSAGTLHRDMAAKDLARASRDYIVRRTKDEVMTDLPPKLFRDAWLDLSPSQCHSYETAESEGVVQLNELGESITIQHVFELVLRLKQICNFDPRTGQSSKLDRLEADLEEVAESGKKAIVFSQWVETLNHLNDKLQRFNPLSYHGRITAKEREKAITKFRESDEHTVLLLSYGAGAVGLNLQFCSYVFLFDRWWNPAVEDQAINRAHRIGSAGPVTVTRFVTPGSIEQRIDDILREKRELMSMILDNPSDSPRAAGLSQAEIFGLFDLKVTPRRDA